MVKTYIFVASVLSSSSRELRRLPETSARTPHSLSRLTISRHSNPQTASKKKSQNNMDYEENEYGENAVDNMMVDYDYHVNTCELPNFSMNRQLTTLSPTSMTGINIDQPWKI